MLERSPGDLQEATRRRFELRRAVQELTERCLHPAAKWAAEQLCGLPELPASEPREKFSGIFAAMEDECTPMATSSGSRPSNFGSDLKSEPVAATERSDTGELTVEEEDCLLLGKVYLDVREYRRAANVLKGVRGHKARFLRCYSLYLAGEKRREEELLEAPDASAASNSHKRTAVNVELAGLSAELASADERGELDAFGLYLLGMVLARREQQAEARRALCESVNRFPWNWMAWQELQSLCTSVDLFNKTTPSLNPHWMRTFFEASALLDLQSNAEGLRRCLDAAEKFPRSVFVASQTATAHYNLRDFDRAEAVFEEIIRVDPYRIEAMDTYSNILYVKESYSALSYLAHKAVLTDKYRPETCCIVGNYYSLKGQHEKAVLYFRRALRLNRHYLSAWTLMGHEFVEMKNTPAAIDAYRRAVEINPRDYRAWYGLGQTYEILSMPYYALYYFRKATELRPLDARMWCAMAQCYEAEQLQQPEAAIRCYRRAVANNDGEGIALHKLAKLYLSLGNQFQAALFFKRNLQRMEQESIEGGAEAVEALLFLAQHHQRQGQLRETESFCMRLLDYAGPAKEEAKAILREIRSSEQHSLNATLAGTTTPGTDADLVAMSPSMDMDEESPSV